MHQGRAQGLHRRAGDRDSALPTADLAIRKLAAIEALSRYEEASAEMLGSISIDPNLWPTSALIDWMNILKRLSGIETTARGLGLAGGRGARQDAFRAYYRYVPKGVFKVEYTVRYNNAGVFELPATRVEALYAPEMLGELPNLSVEVKEAP